MESLKYKPKNVFRVSAVGGRGGVWAEFLRVSVLLYFKIAINWFALSRRELNSDFSVFQEPPM